MCRPLMNSLVKLEQANDIMELKMAVHGVADSIMGKLDRLSKLDAPKNRLDKLCHPKECASNASKWQEAPLREDATSIRC